MKMISFIFSPLSEKKPCPASRFGRRCVRFTQTDTLVLFGSRGLWSGLNHLSNSNFLEAKLLFRAVIIMKNL